MAVAAKGLEPATTAAAYLVRALDSLQVGPEYRGLLETALSHPGQILSDSPSERWTRLVEACHVVTGTVNHDTAVAAAAVEVFVAGLSLQDHVEDGDPSPLVSAIGSSRSFNVSVGLLFLGQQLLLATERGPKALGALLDSGLRACGGQDRDLTPPPERLSLESALEIASLKSASLVAGVCRLAAVCAGACQKAETTLERFGHSLGLTWQLADDLADFESDTKRGVYGHLVAAYSDAGHASVEGARHYLWTLFDAHRRLTTAIIEELTDVPEARSQLYALLPQAG